MSRPYGPARMRAFDVASWTSATLILATAVGCLRPATASRLDNPLPAEPNPQEERALASQGGVESAIASLLRCPRFEDGQAVAMFPSEQQLLRYLTHRQALTASLAKVRIVSLYYAIIGLGDSPVAVAVDVLPGVTDRAYVPAPCFVAVPLTQPTRNAVVLEAVVTDTGAVIQNRMHLVWDEAASGWQLDSSTMHPAQLGIDGSMWSIYSGVNTAP